MVSSQAAVVLTERRTRRKQSRKERRKKKGKWDTCKKGSVGSSRAAAHIVTPFVPYSPQVSSALFFQYNTQLGPPYHILVDTNFINFSIQNKLDIVQNMMDCLYAKCEQLQLHRVNFITLMALLMYSIFTQDPTNYHSTFPTMWYWYAGIGRVRLAGLSFSSLCTVQVFPASLTVWWQSSRNWGQSLELLKGDLDYWILSGIYSTFLLWLLVYRIAKDPRFERLPCMHKGTYADDCLVNRVTQVNWHCIVGRATVTWLEDTPPSLVYVDYKPHCVIAQVLHCGYMWSWSKEKNQKDPWRAHHVHHTAQIQHREDARGLWR